MSTNAYRNELDAAHVMIERLREENRRLVDDHALAPYLLVETSPRWQQLVEVLVQALAYTLALTVFLPVVVCLPSSWMAALTPAPVREIKYAVDRLDRALHPPRLVAMVLAVMASVCMVAALLFDSRDAALSWGVVWIYAHTATFAVFGLGIAVIGTCADLKRVWRRTESTHA